MWKLVTSVLAKEQGIVVLLDSLEGNAKAEKAVCDLTATNLHTDEGLKTLFDKLDIVFKSEKVDEAYDAYSKFISFQKPDSMAMNDYVVEFDHLYYKMQEHDMKLPDTVLAFKLLDGASLKDDERKLALTVGSDCKFDTMKSALKRVFSTKLPLGPTSSNMYNIKQEEAFYNKKSFYRPPTKFSKADQKKDKFNQLDKFGKISRCIVCDSKMHWASQCQHGTQKHSANITEEEQDVYVEVELILMNSILQEEMDKQEILVAEAAKSAVIDTACTKTFAGENWFNDFVSSLPADKRDIKLSKSNTSF